MSEYTRTSPNTQVTIPTKENQIYITASGLSDVPGDPPDLLEVLHCEAWIAEFCHPIKAISNRTFSYSLKHRAEDWQYERVHQYVSNGAFIQAAVNLGYRYKRDSPLNAYFNMGIKKSVKTGGLK